MGISLANYLEANGYQLKGLADGTDPQDAITLSQLGAAVIGVLNLIGSLDASTNPNYDPGTKGDAYVISGAGKVGGVLGKDVHVGDLLVAKENNAGGDEATVGTSWFVLEMNLVPATETKAGYAQIATQAEVNVGTNDTKFITPLKLANTNIGFSYPPHWITVDGGGNADFTTIKAAMDDPSTGAGDIIFVIGNTTETANINAKNNVTINIAPGITSTFVDALMLWDAGISGYIVGGGTLIGGANGAASTIACVWNGSTLNIDGIVMRTDGGAGNVSCIENDGVNTTLKVTNSILVSKIEDAIKYYNVSGTNTLIVSNCNISTLDPGEFNKEHGISISGSISLYVTNTIFGATDDGINMSAPPSVDSYVIGCLFNINTAQNGIRSNSAWNNAYVSNNTFIGGAAGLFNVTPIVGATNDIF